MYKASLVELALDRKGVSSTRLSLTLSTGEIHVWIFEMKESTAMIGQDNPTTVKFRLSFICRRANSLANYNSAVFPLDHQNKKIRQ